MRISDNKHQLLQSLARNGPRRAAVLGRETGMRVGSLHTTLIRMQGEGLVESDKERGAREYTITSKGLKALYLLNEICALGLAG